MLLFFLKIQFPIFPFVFLLRGVGGTVLARDDDTAEKLTSLLKRGIHTLPLSLETADSSTIQQNKNV